MTALDELYRSFGGLLLIMARKYLCDKQSAEDLLSDVLLKLVKNANQFKDGYNGLNWLFKTIKNTAINENIKQGRQNYVEYDDNFSVREIFNDDAVISGVVISSAMQNLNAQEHDIITKKYWEGLTVREIAKILNLSTAKTQRLIKNAIKKLGLAIGDDFFDNNLTKNSATNAKTEVQSEL